MVLGQTGPTRRRGQWGEINDETCPWVGSNQWPSDQKPSTLPLDYDARNATILRKKNQMYHKLQLLQTESKDFIYWMFYNHFSARSLLAKLGRTDSKEGPTQRHALWFFTGSWVFRMLGYILSCLHPHQNLTWSAFHCPELGTQKITKIRRNLTEGRKRIQCIKVRSWSDVFNASNWDTKIM